MDFGTAERICWCATLNLLARPLEMPTGAHEESPRGVPRGWSPRGHSSFMGGEEPTGTLFIHGGSPRGEPTGGEPTGGEPTGRAHGDTLHSWGQFSARS